MQVNQFLSFQISWIQLSLLLKEGGVYCPRSQRQTCQEGLHGNTSCRTRRPNRNGWVNRASRVRQLIHSLVVLKSCFTTTLMESAWWVLFVLPLGGIFVLFERERLWHVKCGRHLPLGPAGLCSGQSCLQRVGWAKREIKS